MNRNAQKVLCCFSGEWISRTEAVEITLHWQGASGEQQAIFSTRKKLAELIDPQVPLHPELAAGQAKQSERR